MRQSWTDERLDDGFDRVRADISELRGEVASLRDELHREVGSLRIELHDEVGSLRGELHNEVGSLRKEMQQEFRSMQRTLIQLGSGIIVALIGVIATQL